MSDGMFAAFFFEASNVEDHAAVAAGLCAVVEAHGGAVIGRDDPRYEAAVGGLVRSIGVAPRRRSLWRRVASLWGEAGP